MKKIIFIMTFLLGIVSFSDNYFEGFWKINKPFEAEFLLEYKGVDTKPVKPADVYKVHVREKINGKWVYHHTTWLFEKDSYGMTCGYQGNFTCLSFNRSPQGAYVMNDTGKYNIQKMNSQEIENLKKELKTKKWIQW